MDVAGIVINDMQDSFNFIITFIFLQEVFTQYEHNHVNPISYNLPVFRYALILYRRLSVVPISYHAFM